MWHQVTCIGNLGRSPEMRYLPSGKAVTNFSIATSESWTDANGDKQERVVWWKIAVFGKAAEAANKYLDKGSRVMVQGRMNASPEGNPKMWKDANGNERASFELNADTVKFLSPKGEGGGGRDDYEPQDETELPF